MVSKKTSEPIRISLESYTPYPSLRLNALPIVASKEGEIFGLIEKIRSFDPIIAKQFVYIDKTMVDLKHRDQNLKTLFSTESNIDAANIDAKKKLDRFGKDSIAVRKQKIAQYKKDHPDEKDPAKIPDGGFFYHIEDAFTNPMLIETYPELFKTKTNPITNMLASQEKTLENGGWFIIPPIMSNEIDEYCDNKVGKDKPCFDRTSAPFDKKKSRVEELKKQYDAETDPDKKKKLGVDLTKEGERVKNELTPHILREDYGIINACRYENHTGIYISKSNNEIITKILTMPLYKSRGKEYPKIAPIINSRIKKFTAFEGIKRSLSDIELRDIASDWLVTKSDSDLITEEERIKTVANMLNITEDAVKSDYTFETLPDIRNEKVRNQIQRFGSTVTKEFQRQTRDNRKKACYLTTVLRDLQDRNGWHNRYEPTTGFSQITNIKDFMVGKNEIVLNRAQEQIQNRLKLLELCKGTTTGKDCLHPVELANLGIYSGQNEEGKITPQSTMAESSLNTRVYAFAEIPVEFIRNTSSTYDRYKSVQRLMESLKNASYTNSAKTFEDLQVDSNITGFPLLRPLKSDGTAKIPFIPSQPQNIREISLELVAQEDQRRKDIESTSAVGIIPVEKDARVKYEKALADHTKTWDLYDWLKIDASEITPKDIVKEESDGTKFKRVPIYITGNSFYLYDSKTSFKGEPIVREDGMFVEYEPRCMDAKFETGTRWPKLSKGKASSKGESFFIRPDNMVLLDGANNVIRWKEPTERGTLSRSVKDVILEIAKRDGVAVSDDEKITELINDTADNPLKLSAANPKKWKWTCIEDKAKSSKDGLSPDYLSTHRNVFTIDRHVFRRAVDVTQRDAQEKVELAVRKDSFSKALKDVAITSHNLVMLGNMMQLPDYVSAIDHEGDRVNWLKKFRVDLPEKPIEPKPVKLGEKDEKILKAASTAADEYSAKMKEYKEKIEKIEPRDWPFLQPQNYQAFSLPSDETRVSTFNKIRETADKAQNSLLLNDEWDVVKKLVTNGDQVATTPITVNKFWSDLPQKFLMLRRKDISAESFGIPKELFVNPITNDVKKRIENQNKSIIGIKTNLNTLFTNILD